MTVSNFGQVLRGKYILQEENADTPVRRLYFAIQSALIDGGLQGHALSAVNKFGAQAFVSVATDEARAHLLTAMEWAHQNDLYKALMELRPLLSEGEQPATDHAAARPELCE